MPQNLPKELGSQDPITAQKLKALWANLPLGMDGLSLQKGTVVFQPDPTLALSLNRSGASGNAKLGKLNLQGLIDYSGNWNANAQYPVLGGLLSGSIAHGSNGNSYGLQYQRNF